MCTNYKLRNRMFNHTLLALSDNVMHQVSHKVTHCYTLGWRLHNAIYGAIILLECLDTAPQNENKIIHDSGWSHNKEGRASE